MNAFSKLKNFARGSGKYHDHRLELVRELLDDPRPPEPLSNYLRDQFFKLDAVSWTLFAFGPKDWQLCERLLAATNVTVEAGMLSLVGDYLAANLGSVRKLIALGDRISARLLREEAAELDPKEDQLTAIDAASLFSVRVGCAQLQASPDAMHQHLRARFPRGWGRGRLIAPLIYHFIHRPPAASLDNFLSYIVTGREHDAERLALKLLLSDEAARQTSLAFQIYVGLMGHPYDALDLVLDHIEFRIADGDPLPAHLASFLGRMAELLPETRADHLARIAAVLPGFAEAQDTSGLRQHFDLTDAELARYVALSELAPLPPECAAPKADRPFSILTNMRIAQYPDPLQFQLVVGERAIWFFVNGGRFIGALLRSIYMVERAHRDLEARDAQRLMMFLGHVNAFVASAPSAMAALRAATIRGATTVGSVDDIEYRTDAAIRSGAPFRDRLWINELQWTLRRFEERGKIAEWLAHVRAETKLRPSFLTGINWHWVEEVIGARRLKPFRSFDGAYLFLLMEMETQTDPQRLRLTLDPLIRGLDYKDVVATTVQQFGEAAPGLIRRYLSTQNMLASGLAPNFIAALDGRVRALEACIAHFGYGPLLTQDMYDAEVRALTAELLLTSVNAGKFEVPWDTYRKDVLDAQRDLILAVESLKPRLDEEDATQMSALLDQHVSFPNGRAHTYRIRRKESPVFALVAAVISDYMQHPAFGLEMILSGRFRHNNLLQELWTAINGVVASNIPSVPGFAVQDLVAPYKTATEEFVDRWCSRNMQSRRPEKKEGLFDLVPDQREADRLTGGASNAGSSSEVVGIVVEWIKEKLRQQVPAAGEGFVTDAMAELSSEFAAIRDQQLEDDTNRTNDVQKVHSAVSGAVERRVHELRSWFDGVDATSAGPVSLHDLSLATEALFENMIAEKSLKAEPDQGSHDVSFEPGEVKIAFDLLREIFYNALRHGTGPEVLLSIKRVEEKGGTLYSFRNPADPGEEGPSRETISGSRYIAGDEALFRDKNSGRAKIAASSATLIGSDAEVLCVRGEDAFEFVVPLRPCAIGSRPRNAEEHPA